MTASSGTNPGHGDALADETLIELGADDGPTRRRRWPVALVTAAVLGTAVAGVALVRHDEPLSVVASEEPGPTSQELLVPSSSTTEVPTTLPVVTTVSTTTSTVARRTSPSATVATTTTQVPEALPRPACAGEKSGYGGYGCTVSATEGRLSVRFIEYGQILQVGRDHLQLHLTAEDSEGGAEVALRFSHGDGTVDDQSFPYRCGSNEPVSIWGGESSYVYPTTGSYTVTAVVTTGLCDPDTGEMHDQQTVTVSIPVLVCNRIDVVDGDVRCTSA